VSTQACDLVTKLSHKHKYLVSQITPFTERGRVWSRWNHRVVPMAETWCDQSDQHSS